MGTRILALLAGVLTRCRVNTQTGVTLARHRKNRMHCAGSEVLADIIGSLNCGARIRLLIRWGIPVKDKTQAKFKIVWFLPLGFISPSDMNGDITSFIHNHRISSWCCSSGFWRRVNSSVDADVSEKHTVCIFSPEDRQVYAVPKPWRKTSNLTSYWFVHLRDSNVGHLTCGSQTFGPLTQSSITLRTKLFSKIGRITVLPTNDSSKTPVFCDVAPCSLIEIDRRFRGAYCLHRQGDDDGRNKHFWNIGQFLPHFTAQHPRTQSSSYSPPWEPEISQLLIDYRLISGTQLLVLNANTFSPL
jgi:hypothetical protein